MTNLENYSIELLLNGDKCPKCKDGLIQTTPLSPPDSGVAVGCNKCTFPQEEVAKENNENKINQRLVDNIFSLIDGEGTIEWYYEDCKFIQETLKEEFGIHLSINECRKYWKWRSNEWDASFLCVNGRSKEEIIEWFYRWANELDVWDLVEDQDE